jgi:HSP20 family protein
MTNKSLARTGTLFPGFFNDFFKPWSEWFNGDDYNFGPQLTVPAVNITESEGQFEVSLAAPGMKKEDFKIDLNGNMLTISSEKEEKKEEKDEKFTRREYNYSTFSRTFTLPEWVMADKIEAHYVNGVLKLVMPKKEEAKKPAAKQIAIK